MTTSIPVNTSTKLQNLTLLETAHNILTKRYKLSCKTLIGDDIGHGYLNLAWHCLCNGRPDKAVDYAAVAFSDFYSNREHWAKAAQSVFASYIDTGKLRPSLNGNAQMLLDAVLREERLWHERRSRQVKTESEVLLVAEEGRAVWREIYAKRLIEERRVSDPLEPFLKRIQSADARRAEYLSAHQSNPYRRGLELYEGVARGMGDCFTASSVATFIVFDPFRYLQGRIPADLLEVPAGVKPGWSPTIRLSRCSCVKLAEGDDIETILRTIHQQLDGGTAGLLSMERAAFDLSLARDFDPKSRRRRGRANHNG